MEKKVEVAKWGGGGNSLPQLTVVPLPVEF